MHYNLQSWDGAPDQTSIDFDTEPTVEHEGAFAPWLDALWTFGGMTIPAGSTATFVEEGDPTSFWGLFALRVNDGETTARGAWTSPEAMGRRTRCE